MSSAALRRMLLGQVTVGEETEGTAIPSGLVGFMFTDVEGSTRLWVADRRAMSASLEVHDRLLREVVESHGGHVFTTAGDSFAVAFDTATDAVAAALEAQKALGAAARQHGRQRDPHPPRRHLVS